jgi:electron transport complex protein RnfD
MGKLIVSLSPHAHGKDTVERNMYGVIIALLPALLVSFWFFGIGSAIVCATSVIACVLFEWAINKFILGRQQNTVLDGSAALTGLLLGFNLPSNLPVWIIIIGALVAIGVGKMSFGGLGQNIFNPALVGRCFLLVSFPAQMTSWPKIGQHLSYLDAETGATPLYYMKEAIKNGDLHQLEKVPDSVSLLLGNGYAEGMGTIGEVCALALLLGLAYMLWKKIITWHIPVSIIGTVFVLAGLFHLANPVYADPLTGILSGGLMLGAIFMATDYVTSPMTPKGQIIYGVSIGVLTLVIRNWGSYPEGMSFAILIMNAFTPLINMYVKPKRFGEVPEKK